MNKFPQDIHGKRLEDKLLTCLDCQEEFPWTKEEQKFYAERELTEPKRCKECRERRKRQAGNIK
jgi:hypothetical protein